MYSGPISPHGGPYQYIAEAMSTLPSFDLMDGHERYVELLSPMDVATVARAYEKAVQDQTLHNLLRYVREEDIIRRYDHPLNLFIAVVSLLSERRIPPFYPSWMELHFVPAEPDYDKLPITLKYLAPAAKLVGFRHYRSELSYWLSGLADEDRQLIRKVAQRISERDDLDNIFHWMMRPEVATTIEAQTIYNLLRAIRFARLRTEGHSQVLRATMRWLRVLRYGCVRRWKRFVDNTKDSTKGTGVNM